MSSITIQDDSKILCELANSTKDYEKHCSPNLNPSLIRNEILYLKNWFHLLPNFC